jgi:hypothetical protein
MLKATMHYILRDVWLYKCSVYAIEVDVRMYAIVLTNKLYLCLITPECYEWLYITTDGKSC